MHTHKQKVITIFLLCLHINIFSVVSFLATGEMYLYSPGTKISVNLFFISHLVWTSEECFFLSSHHWTQDAVIEYILWIFIQLHKLKVANKYEIRKLKFSCPLI